MASGPSALQDLAQALASWLFAQGRLCVPLVLCWGPPVCSVLQPEWMAAARVPRGLGFGDLCVASCLGRATLSPGPPTSAGSTGRRGLD